MKKKVLAIGLVVGLLFMISASATMTRVQSIPLSLTFSGNTAYCTASITAEGKSIDATLELWRGRTKVASWSQSGSSYLSIRRSATITSGQSYTLRLSGNIDGQKISVPSVTRTAG